MWQAGLPPVGGATARMLLFRATTTPAPINAPNNRRGWGWAVDTLRRLMARTGAGPVCAGRSIDRAGAGVLIFNAAPVRWISQNCSSF